MKTCWRRLNEHGLLREPMSSDPPMFSSSLLLTDRDCERGAAARGAAVLIVGEVSPDQAVSRA